VPVVLADALLRVAGRIEEALDLLVIFGRGTLVGRKFP